MTAANKGYPKIIIGIDPGTVVTGYGVIEWDGRHCRAVDYGCIKPPASLKLTQRYLIIFNAIEELLTRFSPHAFVIETQYVKDNIQSAIKLGMARGVAMIPALLKEIEVHEYAPSKPKLAVTGNGRATKYQVQGMIKTLLNLPKLPTPADAADALALAMCHIHTLKT